MIEALQQEFTAQNVNVNIDSKSFSSNVSDWIIAAPKPKSVIKLIKLINTVAIAKIPKSEGFNNLAKTIDMAILTNIPTYFDIEVYKIPEINSFL